MSRKRELRGLPAGQSGSPDDEMVRPPMHQPFENLEAPPYTAPAPTELFVWFEDRRRPSHSAGFPECLLPYGPGLRVVERRYVDGHLHLLAAVRLRCDEHFGERVAAIYTGALALGMIAWVGTGARYRRAWMQMYPRAERIPRPCSRPANSLRR